MSPLHAGKSHRPALLASSLVLLSWALSLPARSAPVPAGSPNKAAAGIRALVEEAHRTRHLRAVLVRVSVEGREIFTTALGESLPGEAATPEMRFRNGAVAISYVSTLLLRLAERGVVELDGPLARWLPEIPHAERVSLRQLAQMTSGYRDYVHNPAFIDALYRDPFRSWRPRELIAFADPSQLLYEPGTNWNYAHTNVVLLGQALERATGQPLAQLLQQEVLGPLGLRHTGDPGTPAIPPPVLHAYTAERRPALGIPPATPFLEESTFWNPSWTLAAGAIQTTTLADLHATAIGIGSGRLLTPASYRAMVTTDLRGRTTTLPGCSTCFPQGEGYTYGLGIVTTGNWLTQNPLFGGYAASFGYHPGKRIAIAVAVTYRAEAFDADGNYPNEADRLFRRIGALLAPDDAPPMPRSEGG